MTISQQATVVGCHYYSGVEVVYVGQELVLVRESSNPHDKKAILVQTLSGTKLGHLSRTDASFLAPILDQGILVKAFVELIVLKPARLTLRVSFTDNRPTTPKLPTMKRPEGCLPIFVCLAIFICIIWFFLHSK